MTYTYQYNTFEELNRILTKTIDKADRLNKYTKTEISVDKIKDKWQLKLRIDNIPNIKFK